MGVAGRRDSGLVEQRGSDRSRTVHEDWNDGLAGPEAAAAAVRRWGTGDGETTWCWARSRSGVHGESEGRGTTGRWGDEETDRHGAQSLLAGSRPGPPGCPNGRIGASAAVGGFRAPACVCSPIFAAREGREGGRCGATACGGRAATARAGALADGVWRGAGERQSRMGRSRRRLQCSPSCPTRRLPLPRRLRPSRCSRLRPGCPTRSGRRSLLRR